MKRAFLIRGEFAISDVLRKGTDPFERCLGVLRGLFASVGPKGGVRGSGFRRAVINLSNLLADLCFVSLVVVADFQIMFKIESYVVSSDKNYTN